MILVFHGANRGDSVVFSQQIDCSGGSEMADTLAGIG